MQAKLTRLVRTSPDRLGPRGSYPPLRCQIALRPFVWIGEIGMDTPIPAAHRLPVSASGSEPAIEPTAETYGALTLAFDFFNERLFAARLPRCLLAPEHRKGTRGTFTAQVIERTDGAVADKLTLNLAAAPERTDLELLSTLVHEMVHLRQQRFGSPGRGRYHNREWAAMMKAVGLQPSDTGAPGGKETGDRMSHFVVPDGPFARAARELLTTGFAIPWKERTLEPAAGAHRDGEEAVSRSGRWFKFVCPQCGRIARAAYDARLVCGEDMLAMEPEL